MGRWMIGRGAILAAVFGFVLIGAPTLARPQGMPTAAQHLRTEPLIIVTARGPVPTNRPGGDRSRYWTDRPGRRPVSARSSATDGWVGLATGPALFPDVLANELTPAPPILRKPARNGPVDHR